MTTGQKLYFTDKVNVTYVLGDYVKFAKYNIQFSDGKIFCLSMESKQRSCALKVQISYIHNSTTEIVYRICDNLKNFESILQHNFPDKQTRIYDFSRWKLNRRIQWEVPGKFPRD